MTTPRGSKGQRKRSNRLNNFLLTVGQAIGQRAQGMAGSGKRRRLINDVRAVKQIRPPTRSRNAWPRCVIG